MNLQRRFIYGTLTGIITGGGIGILYFLFLGTILTRLIGNSGDAFFEILIGILKLPFGNFFLLFLVSLE